ncbi:metal ABC transporter ATP-binding protein [Corynebacterium choanae]|uniref:ABC transporter ATP-binding protein YtrE n=1 Tax=Corynebacterium choanae TaxID=1862358 RepID=A0A3G6J5X9_9CORY|nr:ATP-binding cassette domain-containing protein [Corynebacterium choanae]AZA13173.1 ABC transporter ATP-binding protein YtrE [Corynebacterium choanae]
MTTTPILARDLGFAYGRHEVLQGITLTVDPGAVVCITGENGSGKSTLLKLCTGALTPTTGELTLFGEPATKRSALRHVGYVPQATSVEKLAFPITSRELVVQGLARHFGLLHIPKNTHYEQADALLETMGLAPVATVPFPELSGGQQQRVLITRALIDNPKLLVLDEPTSGVDRESRRQFLGLIDELHTTRDLTIMIVTHTIDEVVASVAVSHHYRIEQGRLHHVATLR